VRLIDKDRMIRFAAVGLSGVGVNMFFLWFFTEVGGIHYMISSPIAVEISIVSNFVLNDNWTFRDAPDRARFPVRLLRFHLTALGGFVLNYAVLIGLTELAGLYYLLSNLAGIVTGIAWNYTVNVKWTWRRSG